jgi:hypothetical protein
MRYFSQNHFLCAIVTSLSFLFTLFFIGPLTATALNENGALRYTITPEKPESGVPVTIKLTSYATDLGLAHIVWYVNGNVVKDEIAGTSFQFTNGQPGTLTTIDVVVILPSGVTLKEKLEFRPVDVDILWEADTYVPPFYKGKALPTHDASIRLTAFPFEGTSTRPSAFNFTWTFGSAQDVNSGLGKNTSSLMAPWPKSKSPVSVTTESALGTIGGKKTIWISSVDPVVRLYPIDPLAGIRYGREALSLSSKESEVNLRAIPYYFSNKDRLNGKLVYTWQKRGVRVGESDETIRILRSEGGGNIDLTIDNLNRVIQYGKGKAFITFN